MADQIDLESLVQQLKELIPALKGMSSTAASSGKSAGGNSTDRIVNALGKLEIAIKGNTLNKKQERKALNDFQNSVSRATEVQEKYRKKLEEASAAAASTGTSQKRAAKDLLEEYGNSASASAQLRDKFESLGGTSMGATVALKLVTAGLGGAVDGLASYGKALYNGQLGAGVAAQGVGKFTNSIGDASTQLGGMLAAAALVTPALAPLAAGLVAVGGAIKLFTMYMTAAAEMADRQYKTYQTLSKSGITAADGMTGLADAAVKLNYGLDDAGLENFTRLMQESSQSLAALSGSAFEGRKRIAEVGKIFHDLGEKELLQLGVTVQDMNEQFAKQITMQTRLGAAQRKTNDELAQSTLGVVTELDILAKLTGQQKDKLQDQMNAALSEQRWRFKMEALTRSGQEKTVNSLQFLQTAINSSAPEFSQGFRDIVAAGGAVTTEAAQKAVLASNGAILKSAQDALAGGDYVKIFNDLAKTVGGSLNGVWNAGERSIGMFTDLSKTIGNGAQLYDFSNRYIDKEGNLRDKLNDQIIKQKADLDKNTEAQVGLQKEQLQMRNSLQELVREGIGPTTEAFKTLTSVMNDLLAPFGKANRASKVADAAKAKAKAEGKGWFGQQWERVKAGVNAYEQPATGGAAASPGASQSLMPGGPGPTGKASSILDFVGKLESGGNYNVIYGGKTDPNLTNMTVAQVRDYQRNMVRSGSRSSAIGKYQVMGYTLDDLIKQGVVSPGDRFDQATQDKIGLALLKRRGYDAFVAGKLSPEQFASNLSKEWAALPTSGGASFWQGVAGNRALTSYGNLMGVLSGNGGPSAASGGILSGPSMGYQATLHGTEAVIPLPGNRKVPVDMSGMTMLLQDTTKQQTDLLMAQTSRLDDLVSLMKRQISVNERILQQAG